MKTIYIAGPMRHRPRWNFPEFDAARDRLQLQGWNVVSPADLDREAGFDETQYGEDTDWSVVPNGFDIHAAIDRDVEALKKCDAIYMLAGWEKSKGAKAEKALAEWLGLEVCCERYFTRMPRIIGITGRAFAGKDTVANILNRQVGYNVYHWADPLRKLAYAINMPIHNSCIRDFVDELGWDEAKKIPAIREHLQTLGTEGVRDCIHPDTWVWTGSQRMDDGDLWVVPDCRFRNEADWVKQNGVLLLIKRPGVGSVNNHVSDAGLIDRFADITIENDGTVEDLEHKVLNLFSGL